MRGDRFYPTRAISYSFELTPQDLIAFRARMGWRRVELARRLDISASRLADYELGHSRGKNPQPAPIPRLVELACAWLGEQGGENRPLTPVERAALWREFLETVPKVDHVIDDSREALYEPPRGL
jgi:transcriptional regulator with XRE-family HTH domain